MSDSVGEMTKSEFREMIESVVEQKLLDLLGDPDEGLDLRSQIRERLLRQQASVGSGDRGESFEDLAANLGLG
jgi:hypothetical protein